MVTQPMLTQYEKLHNKNISNTHQILDIMKYFEQLHAYVKYYYNYKIAQCKVTELSTSDFC